MQRKSLRQGEDASDIEKQHQNHQEQDYQGENQKLPDCKILAAVDTLDKVIERADEIQPGGGRKVVGCASGGTSLIDLQVYGDVRHCLIHMCEIGVVAFIFTVKPRSSTEIIRRVDGQGRCPIPIISLLPS